MTTTAGLPLPRLSRGRFASTASSHPLYAYTDEALFSQTGVRVAFTERGGGASQGAFDSLNLGSHVGDDLSAVQANREAVACALGFAGVPVVVPKQVHGDRLVAIDGTRSLADVRADAATGADGLLISSDEACGLLCFADCTPVILVAPTGSVAVVHAGWRGVRAHIAVKALSALCAEGADASVCNVYIGPYIHADCFEVSPELRDEFAATFGADCTPDARHIDMGACLRRDLYAAGVVPERIADVDACTVCTTDRFYSYRASGGVCGRHGAFAARVR